MLKEKPILVSFFCTVCVPCKKEIPELEKLHAKYKKKIAFFLIATDAEGADAVEPYVRRMGVTIPVLINKYSDAAKGFGVDKYPSFFIIGRDGKVRYAGYGYKEETIQTVEEVIKGLR